MQRKWLLFVLMVVVIGLTSLIQVQANTLSLQDKIVEIAQGEIGKGETVEDNVGEDINKYFGRPNDLAKWNWCSAFAGWVVKQAGVEDLKNFSFSARKLYNEGVDLGWKVEQPKPGDIVVWWTKDPNSWHGHIGIIERIVFRGEKGYTLETIEGNVGEFPSKVMRCKHRTNIRYKMKRLVGYIRIPNE